jgi:hypothetical protein
MRWAPQVILYLEAVNTKTKCVGKVASIRYSSRTVAIEDYLLLEHAVFFVKKKNYFRCAQYCSEMGREMEMTREMGDGDS